MDYKDQKSEDVYIKVPTEILERLDLKEETKAQIHVNEQGVYINNRKKNTEKTVPLTSITIASLLTLGVCLLVFRDFSQIPLIGQRSIASMVILVGVITGMINFTYYFIKDNKSNNSSLKLYWRNLPVVLLSYLVIIVVAQLLFFKVMGQLFMGASFDIYTSSCMAAVMTGIVNYVMIYSAKSITPTSLIRSLVFVILGGVFIAMVTNRDQQWWLYNFSFLGTPEATNSWQFNLTLILSSLLMVALIDYIFVFLYNIEGKTKRLITLKVLLLLTAICLGGVGFFPYNDSLFYQSMHNRVAGYLVYLFIILIISIRWLLPNVSKHFLRISYSIGAMLGIICVLFLGVHYLSLTAFELFAFVLAFSWLLLLLQHIIDIVNTANEVYTVEIIRQPITEKVESNN
ncbi:MAG: hypothetical protein RR565_03230 [Erysipelothrix sp.]